MSRPARIKYATVVVGILAGLSWFGIVRATGVEEFGLLAPTTPQLATFQQWHKAVVAGDFETYRRLSVDLDGVSSESRKMAFQEHRRTVPLQIKVTPPKTVPTGAVEFHAAGCRDNVRHVALIIVSMRSGSPRVLSTAWAPQRNKTARDCPV